MYRCFKLDISESDFFDLLPAAKATWKRIGMDSRNEQKTTDDMRGQKLCLHVCIIGY